MADELSAPYAHLLDGTYDCVDRIVLNAYHSLCYSAGGFRLWWRSLMGGSEEQLDSARSARLWQCSECFHPRQNVCGIQVAEVGWGHHFATPAGCSRCSPTPRHS
jgi:hypothetical protein